MFSSFQVSWRRTNSYVGYLKEADEIDCGSVKLSEDFMVADIDIPPRHANK
jgi:DNA repair and recombination protein RAD54 and RAD54-like protein